MNDKEITVEEFTGACNELRAVANRVISQSLEIRDKLGAVIQDGSLRGILTMIKEDVWFRHNLELREPGRNPKNYGNRI